MSWLGLDIGGANLKAADGRGWARSEPFALWRDPHGLSAALESLMGRAPHTDRLAITMTGELCDCFRTKEEGVCHILNSVVQAAGKREVLAYLVDGRLVPVAKAYRSPQLAMASNWHALAQFACRFVDGNTGLLIDVGSTTTDIVPLVAGRPRPQGLNDTDRLLSGELVYAGVGRTPVCAITQSLPWRDLQCPVAAELFATTADAYVILGELAEQPESDATADGRPLTKEFARERLARMICADASTFRMEDATLAAITIHGAQSTRLGESIRQVISGISQPECVVLSGSGEFLAGAVAGDILPAARTVGLSQQLGTDSSECAPAYALATLAGEGNLAK